MKNILILLLILDACCLRAQTTRYVNHAAMGANTGQNWQNAYQDLQTALQTAQAGDEIWVAQGIYYPTATTDRLASFSQTSGVGLYGGFAGNETNRSERNWTLHETVLSGDIGLPGDSTDNVFNVVYMFQPDSNTVLDGFTIAWGQADSTEGAFGSFDRLVCGGGLYVDADTWDAFVEVKNCRFRHNTAAQLGGGVLLTGKSQARVSPRFESCRFEDNHSRYNGGGLARFGGSGPDRGYEFVDCTFENNTADYQGGGLYYRENNGQNRVGIYQSRFLGNVAMSSGGGMYLLVGKPGESALEIIGCDFEKNQSLQGFACTILNNGEVYKGGIYVKNCNFKKNFNTTTNFNNPSMIHVDLIGELASTMSMVNNIFIDNYSPLNLLTIEYNYSNLVIDHCLITKNSSEGAKMMFLTGFQNTDIINTVISSNQYCIYTLHSSTFNSNSIKIKYKNCSFHDNLVCASSPFIELGIIPNFQFTNNTFCSNPEISNSSLLKFTADSCFLINNYFNYTPGPNAFAGAGNKYYYIENSAFSGIDCANLTPNVVCGPGILSGIDPMFRDTANGDFSLKPCSPLVNAGNNAAATGLLTDISGAPRIQEGIVDIGAYESPAFALATTPQIQPACTNSPGGAISLTTANGCEPFSYTWSPPAGNGASINDLPPGDYHFTVTDNRGRQITSLATVPAAPSPVLTPAIQDLQCGFITGGSISANVISGTAPFSFVWENGATGIQRDMLPAGQYQVTVTDASGCQDSAQIHIQQSGQITLQVDGQPISCFGAADAQLSATAATGKAPFTYQWSQGATDSLLSPLGPGQYTVTVSDAYGCTATFSFNLSDPPALQAAAIAQPTNNLQNPSGSATAIPSGGTPTHTYAWSNGGLTQTINNLPPGVYTVTVTDAHGCSATATAEVKLVISTGEAPGLAVQVWPNPMRERLDIEALQLPAGTYRFVLRDVLGREVAAAAVAGGRAVLATGDLPPGAYLWYLETEDGVLASGKVLR